jgi:hypothetical protein
LALNVKQSGAADTIGEALKRGDVKAEKNGKAWNYQLSNLESISPAVVDRWRKGDVGLTG